MKPTTLILSSIVCVNAVVCFLVGETVAQEPVVSAVKNQASQEDWSIYQSSSKKSSYLRPWNIQDEEQDGLAPNIDNQDDSEVTKDIEAYNIELLSKSIQEIVVDIYDSEERPEDQSSKILGADDSGYYPRSLGYTTVCWQAACIRYQPLYFEDVLLERNGQTANQCFQPYFSAAHFFLSSALLPINMVQDHPKSCDYPLGYCLPGKCPPLLKENWFYR